MGKKTAGDLGLPPTREEFDRLPLATFGVPYGRILYRLHSTNDKTGAAWPPIHFSAKGTSRFDPQGGVGTLYLAETLAGALMELFDDHWGPVGSIGRSVTAAQLSETWVTRVSLPPVKLFDATGANLSKIGTDGQLLTGLYATTQIWAERLMNHPAAIDGMLFRSRHDPSRLNVALFNRSQLLPEVKDSGLRPVEPDRWVRMPAHGDVLVHGEAIRLCDHPDLHKTLVELEVARLP